MVDHANLCTDATFINKASHPAERQNFIATQHISSRSVIALVNSLCGAVDETSVDKRTCKAN